VTRRNGYAYQSCTSQYDGLGGGDRGCGRRDDASGDGRWCLPALQGAIPREHRVTVIERELSHAFAPSFLWVMTGDRRPEQVTRDVRELVRPGVEVRQGDVRAIDLTNRRVEFDRDFVGYDYLVVALGAELAPDAMPGLAAGAHTFYTLAGATRLRAALDDVKTGTVAVVVSALPYKCPGAPHEAAMLLADVFRQSSRGDTVSVHLFTPEPQPMPVAGPALGDAVRQMLEQRGVSFHPSHRLAWVNAETRELQFEGKPPVNYDLLAAIPPHRSPAEGVASSEQFCGDGFCMLEAGDDLAGVAFGEFFHQPSPDVHVKSIGRAWHLGKVLFEQWWLSPWGVRRSLLKSALTVGSRFYGVPVNL
jgi:NADPH-dependent 2,4-dienoyl-CoA reductase/sulfur reductase-like enzyme